MTKTDNQTQTVGELVSALAIARTAAEQLKVRLDAAEAALKEGLMICQEMVKAEDDLIADLQAEGNQQGLLAIDFPIMHRMRAFVARALTQETQP